MTTPAAPAPPAAVAPQGPQAVMHLFHETTFDMVKAGDLGDRESLGTHVVASMISGEEEVRHKIRFALPDGFTRVEISQDKNMDSPREVLHLVETLLARHSDAIHSVSCSVEAFAQKVAAVVGATVVPHNEDYAVPAPVEEDAQ